jgi:hypothetical protein
MVGAMESAMLPKQQPGTGIDFTVSVSRKPAPWTIKDVFFTVKNYYASWYRIGTAGDPSHDWENTIEVCELLKATGKTPVIITKHWVKFSDDHLHRLKAVSAVINTSTSGLDTDQEIKYRLSQIERIRSSGLRSVNRVITCNYGASDWAKSCNKKQDHLLSIGPIIDNPLRAQKSNERVKSGDILLTRMNESVGGGKLVSLHGSGIYLGTCNNCQDQCGVSKSLNQLENNEQNF